MKRQLSPLRYSLCTLPLRNTLDFACKVSLISLESHSEHPLPVLSCIVRQRSAGAAPKLRNRLTKEDLLRRAHEARLGRRGCVQHTASDIDSRGHHDEAADGPESARALRIPLRRRPHMLNTLWKQIVNAGALQGKRLELTKQPSLVPPTDRKSVV